MCLGTCVIIYIDLVLVLIVYFLRHKFVIAYISCLQSVHLFMGFRLLVYVVIYLDVVDVKVFTKYLGCSVIAP